MGLDTPYKYLTLALENNADIFQQFWKKKKSLHNIGKKLLYRLGLNQFVRPVYSKCYRFF